MTPVSIALSRVIIAIAPNHGFVAVSPQGDLLGAFADLESLREWLKVQVWKPEETT